MWVQILSGFMEEHPGLSYEMALGWFEGGEVIS